jgi:hypothetical protein
MLPVSTMPTAELADLFMLELFCPTDLDIWFVAPLSQALASADELQLRR